MKKIVGGTLCGLILLSAVLAVAGIWGAVTEETVWQMLFTFGVVAAASGALGKATEIYFP